ncbi:MAG: ribosome recycling factor [Bacteroidales bacterium]|nr:ribosome recycling factor [Bacteroidales bacterium]
MKDEVDFYYEEAHEKMEKAATHLSSELLKLRAGKASPQMLEGITVEFYGVNTPLSQAANINTPDARTITIQPWDKKLIDVIEKAIFAANIGLTPMNNGEMIRLSIPPLTEERRKGLVKQSKSETEIAKISIRNARREAIESYKKLSKSGLEEDMAKDAEARVEKLTDQYYKKVEEILAKKEAEIMTI